MPCSDRTKVHLANKTNNFIAMRSNTAYRIQLKHIGSRLSLTESCPSLKLGRHLLLLRLLQMRTDKVKRSISEWITSSFLTTCNSSRVRSL